MKILIYGAGYVGYSNAIGLALENSVDIIEPNTGKCDKIRKNISPIKDEYIYDYLKNNDIRIGTYNKPLENIKSYDCIILALPTDYDENLNDFDTSILDNVLCELARENIRIPIVIKSTVPIGYTKKMKNKHQDTRAVKWGKHGGEMKKKKDVRIPPVRVKNKRKTRWRNGFFFARESDP